MKNRKFHVTIFNEHNQDRSEPVKSIYPDGIHSAIARSFEDYEDFEVTIATQDMPSHGLTEEVLARTDVLIWWSHIDNDSFDDQVAARICYHVVCRGMGFIAIHASIFSKPWQQMLGIYYDAGAWGRFRTMEKGEKEKLWIINPSHPITYGLPDCIEIPADEMYGEPQLIPDPDQIIFIAWWEGGDVCRSGNLFYKGRGKLFQFTPGHETFPILYQAEIQQILRNAVRFMAPSPDMTLPVNNHEHLSGEPKENLDHRK